MLEALDKDGRPAQNVVVTVRALTGGSGIVFQGMTDKQGRVNFTSKAPAEMLKAAPWDVADMVYEVYFVTPGEVRSTTFSVPHLKRPEAVSPKDKETIERGREKQLQVRVQADATTLSEVNATEAMGTVTPSQLGCVMIGLGWEACVTEEQAYTKETEIARVFSDDGEQVEVTFATGSKVKIESGLKSGSGSWSVDGSVALSTSTTTSVAYSFTNSVGKMGRAIHANYEYLYQKKEINYQYKYQYTEHTVTPIRLVGSSTYYYWFNDSRNGKTVSDVQNNVYGGWFSVNSNASTTKSYTKENEYSLAASVPTPVGTFSPKVTTAYSTAHTIKWSTNSSNTYYHYDWDRSGGMWYVTR